MNWIQLRNKVLAAAVSLACATASLGQELPSGETDSPVRFASVTEAVSADPETAPEIVGSLSRSFPESAPVIATSAVEGLPEATDEAVGSIVDAAVEAAPEQQEAIEAAVAAILPGESGAENAASEELEPEAVEAEDASTEPRPGDGDAAGPEAGAAEAAGLEPVVDGEADEEMVPEELPERLEREVALLESLLGTFPDDADRLVRRSVGRVAEEEGFWTAALVEAALARAPAAEEEIVREAIGAAPHHEGAIRAAAGWDPVVDEDANGEDPARDQEIGEPDDEALPERLQREVALLESLLSTFPDDIDRSVRRSVGRVADEEAFWTVTLVETVLAHAPERNEEIARGAIAAAPRHEEAILAATGVDELEREFPEESVDREEEIVAEPFTYPLGTEAIELHEERLTVRFDVPGTQPSRLRLAVESLELSLQSERYFDPYKGRYLERDIALLTGDGIVGLVLKLHPGDTEQLAGLAGVLEEFEKSVAGADAFVASRRADEAAELLLTEIRSEIGSVYFYPSKKEVTAYFAGDFRDEIYTLRMGGTVSLTPDTVPAVRHLVENLPRYERVYRERIEARERQIEEFHNFTRKQTSETAQEEKEES